MSSLVEQKIAQLKAELDLLLAEQELQQQILDDQEFKEPTMLSVDNPNKIPMIAEFNDYLNVALAGYLKPEGDNTPAKEDETSFKSKFGIKLLDIAGHHGAKAINDLPDEFEGGKVKYLESIITNEAKIMIMNIKDLLSGRIMANGGYETALGLMYYIHDWNIATLKKFSGAYFEIPPRKAATIPENALKARETLAGRSPEERARRTYKSVTRPPIVYRKMTPAEAHYDNWGSNHGDLTKAPDGIAEASMIKINHPVMNDPFYKTDYGKSVIAGNAEFRSVSREWDDIAGDGQEQWDKTKEDWDDFAKRQDSIKDFKADSVKGEMLLELVTPALEEIAIDNLKKQSEEK